MMKFRYEGERLADVIDSRGLSPFRLRVYLELLNVPRGETITYGELARRIGCGSAQAVGQALKHNPFAPEIPCHRVIAADGSLCGFGGSRSPKALKRKRMLLEAEKIELSRPNGNCRSSTDGDFDIISANDGRGDSDREGGH